MKNCVLIRVYNRIEDLCCNLRIIRDTWLGNDYDIVVVFNGGNSGYRLPEIVYQLTNHVYVLNNNSGHLSGNSQLLIEGIRNIDFDLYDYIILLEADTWIYTDRIITKYTGKLEASKSVWASARWYDRFYSLATDFAIVKSPF